MVIKNITEECLFDLSNFKEPINIHSSTLLPEGIKKKIDALIVPTTPKGDKLMINTIIILYAKNSIMT